MEFLKQFVCSDIFNIILSYHDPIAELQKHRKRILYWVFKMAEPLEWQEVYPLAKCEEWLYRYIYNGGSPDFNNIYSIYRSEIWENRVRTHIPYYPDLI